MVFSEGPNMDPVIPSLPTQTDNLLTAPANISGSVITKEGKKYKYEVKTIHHDTIWKVWQGVQVFFLTLMSFGIGFAFRAFRDSWKNKWQQALTGEETIPVYTKLPHLLLTSAMKCASSIAFPLNISKGLW